MPGVSWSIFYATGRDSNQRSFVVSAYTGGTDDFEGNAGRICSKGRLYVRRGIHVVSCDAPAAPFISRLPAWREISGYSGIPDHIEIRWANDRDHGRGVLLRSTLAFDWITLWKSRARSRLRLCNAHVSRGMRSTCLYVHATNLYRHASTGVYRV